jgi:hypothetical protein
VSSLVRGPTAHVLFDRIEAGDMVQRLAGRGGAGCGMDVEELAPDMRPTGYLCDALAIEPVEPGIAIGVQIALECSQVRDGAFALAVGRVAKQHGRRGLAASPALVAHIGPQPARPGATGAGGQNRHGRVVGVEGYATHDVALERVDQRVEERGRAPDPVGEGGAGKVDALARVDARLAIERQMVGVFGHQHMCEQPGTGPTPLDGHGTVRNFVREAGYRH